MTQEEMGNLMLEMKNDFQDMKDGMQEIQESLNYMKFMDEQRDEKIAGLVDGHKVIIERLDSIEEKLESHQLELDDHNIRISALESKRIVNQ